MTLPVPPDPPATVDQTSYYAWQIAIQYQQLQGQLADQASAAQYRTDHLAAMAANTAALNRQADAIVASAAAQTASLNALDKYTDAELMAKFTASLISDWGAAGRGASSIVATAKQMVVEYRKLYP